MVDGIHMNTIDIYFCIISLVALLLILIGGFLGWKIITYKGQLSRMWFCINSIGAYILLYICIAGANPLLKKGIIGNDIFTLFLGIGVTFLGVLLLMTSTIKRINDIKGVPWWIFPIIYFLSVVRNPINEIAIFILQGLGIVLLFTDSEK